MGEFEKYIARSFYFWMVRFLRTKYKQVADRLHHPPHRGQGGRRGDVLQPGRERRHQGLLGLRAGAARSSRSAIHPATGTSTRSTSPTATTGARSTTSAAWSWSSSCSAICNVFGYGEIQRGRAPLAEHADVGLPARSTTRKFIGVTITEQGGCLPGPAAVLLDRASAARAGGGRLDERPHEHVSTSSSAAIERVWEIAAAVAGWTRSRSTSRWCRPTIMYEFGAYGLPGRFSHWTHGKAYHQMKTMYDYGLSKIYELVINANPAYAFLLENNSCCRTSWSPRTCSGTPTSSRTTPTSQHTNREMVETVSVNAERIRQYEFEHGREGSRSSSTRCSRSRSTSTRTCACAAAEPRAPSGRRRAGRLSGLRRPVLRRLGERTRPRRAAAGGSSRPSRRRTCCSSCSSTRRTSRTGSGT